MAGAVFGVERVLQDGEDAEEHEEHLLKKRPSEKPVALTLNDELKLDHVAFRYGSDLLLVVKDVCAKIKVGSYVCIFGPSGCGKSTLVSLLEGVNRCTGGHIYMDGVDIASMPLSDLRRNLGVVFQDTYVLDGTIRENIEFGYDNRSFDEKAPISMDRIVEAAKDAHIHEFIETLANKYDTVIGLESDISLSGGQLQRICGLARALVRKPALLVLDEATSALDTISEQKIIATVEQLRANGMTTVSVSHHTSTAVNADMIIVLAKGGVVDQIGSYNDLIEAGGLFAELVEAGKK